MTRRHVIETREDIATKDLIERANAALHHVTKCRAFHDPTWLTKADAAFEHVEKCPMVIGLSYASTPIYDALVLENLHKMHDAIQGTS